MAGTVTMIQTNYKVFGETTIKKLVFTCTADVAAASYPETSTGTVTGAKGQNTTHTQWFRGWFLHKIIVDPGAVAPTVDSDLTIKDDHGIDVLDGNGTDLIHNTDSKQSYAMIDGVPSLQPMMSDLTLAITNNAVNSAVLTVTLVFVRTIM